MVQRSNSALRENWRSLPFFAIGGELVDPAADRLQAAQTWLTEKVGGTAVEQPRAVYMSADEVWIGARRLARRGEVEGRLGKMQAAFFDDAKAYKDVSSAGLVAAKAHIIRDPLNVVTDARASISQTLVVELADMDADGKLIQNRTPNDSPARRLRFICRSILESGGRTTADIVPSLGIRGPFVPLVNFDIASPARAEIIRSHFSELQEHIGQIGIGPYAIRAVVPQ